MCIHICMYLYIYIYGLSRSDAATPARPLLDQSAAPSHEAVCLPPNPLAVGIFDKY